MPDAPRPELLEIIADLSGLLDDLDRARLARSLRAPGPSSTDLDDIIDTLTIAAHDLDTLAEGLSSPGIGQPHIALT